MKKLVIITISVLFVLPMFGQTLAKKKHRSKASVTVTDQSKIPAFRIYTVEIQKQLDKNDLQISDLRFFVINLQQDFNKKSVSAIYDLQKENDELKTDLYNFAKYGEGDWHEFQREFNMDLKTLSADIEYIHARFLKDYLLASL